MHMGVCLQHMLAFITAMKYHCFLPYVQFIGFQNYSYKFILFKKILSDQNSLEQEFNVRLTEAKDKLEI